jgi:hypothetical protein
VQANLLQVTYLGRIMVINRQSLSIVRPTFSQNCLSYCKNKLHNCQLNTCRLITRSFNSKAYRAFYLTGGMIYFTFILSCLDTKIRHGQQQRDQYQNKTLTRVKSQGTGKRRPGTPDSRTSTLTSIDGRALRLNSKNGTITSLDIAAASANMSLAELERYLDGLATPTPTVDEYNAVL